MNLVNFFSLGIWGGGFLPRAGHFGCGFADVGRGGLMAPTSVFSGKLPPNVRNMHQIAPPENTRDSWWGFRIYLKIPCISTGGSRIYLKLL